MKVVFAAEAENDLVQIANHIADDSPAYAITFLDELRQCCRELADAPHAFPLVVRYEHLGVRRRVFQPYLIFYRVSDVRLTCFISRTAGETWTLCCLH